MSFVDATATPTQFQTMSSSFAALGQELDQGGPPADFQSVLAQMNTVLASLGGSAATPSAETAATAQDSLMSTSSLLSEASTGSTTGAYDAVGTPSGLTMGLGTGTATGAAVVSDAANFIGVPYQWGGTSPAGFDCSGLVQYVYREAGVSLPRTSEEQAQVGTPVASLADAQPGDLVFFAGSDGTAANPGHVGIYVGNGQMIDAPYTGTTVQVQSVGDPTAIRRVLPATSPPAAETVAGTETAADMAIPASLGVPADLVPLFESAGQTAGVSPALLAAVAKQESGFQSNAVSGAGAEGLMQLMPSTASSLGVDPLDPAQAIQGAAKLLRGYLQRYNDSVPLALAAYNAGSAAVENYGGVPPYAQTQSYVASITAMLGQEET
jgi:cell wall-associated NlpC family hydrolase